MTSNDFYKKSLVSNFSANSYTSNQIPSTIRNFLNREEYENLKSQGEALDHKIKLRRDFENKYHSIKLNELEKEVEVTKYKNQLANKRNEEILSSLQNDIYRCYQVNKVSSHSKNLLDKDKKRYADYLSYQLSSIRNEFQMKLLSKQNELQGIKSILENQLNHNEEVLKMESEYATKMSRMNQDLAEKIRILHERNKKVDSERKDMMKTYSLIEEKTRDAFMQIFNEKEKLEENAKMEGVIEDMQIEKMLRKFKDEIKKEEKEIKNESVKEKPKNLREKSPVRGKDKSTEKQPEKSLSKSKEKNNLSKSIVSKKEPEKKKYTHTPGVLDRIRNQQKEEKMRTSKASSPRKNETNRKTELSLEKSKSKSKEKVYEVNNNQNNFSKVSAESKNRNSRTEALNRIKHRNRDLSKEKDEYVESDRDYEYEEKKVEKEKKSQREINNDKDPKENVSKSPEKRNIIKKSSNSIDEEIVLKKKKTEAEVGNETSQKEGRSDENQIKIEKTPTIKKKTTIEIYLEDKPELIKVKKEFKLQVLKKIHFQIEKNSKGVKPNNPSTYVYQSKHMNISNSSAIKNKFYEILSILHDSNDTTKDISGINTDSLIYVQFAILNTNNNLNLNPDNLTGEYNEQILENDLDPNITEIFNLITEHMKKIVLDKKTSPHLAANILANYLINFEKDQRMVSNLVAVLERKLSQKIKAPQVGGWALSSAGFNKTAYLATANNASMKSLISIPQRNNQTFHSTSNIITKTNETGGIINDFNEIE